MTVDQLGEYYANLLIIQYRGKENARATVKALAELAVADNLVLDIQNAFDLDSAIGVQLDVVGKYAGVSRYGNDFSGPVTLDDDDFLQIIKIAIVENTSKSSLAVIQELLHTYFDGILYVFDYTTMRMSYFFDSDAVSSSLAQFFVMAGSLPRPMGVQLGMTAYLPSIDDFFGFADGMGVNYNTTGFSNAPDGLTGRMFVSGDFI